MIISIISEARSGSTNLYRWLNKSLEGFEVLWEVVSSCKSDKPDGDGIYRPDLEGIFFDKKWFDPQKDYIINEKYFDWNYDNMTRLVESSDITVALYREDEIRQIESFVHSYVTGEWCGEWVPQNHIFRNIDTIYSLEKTYFERIKKEFKDFRDTHNLKTFSYEDLYYRNKINEFKEYTGLNIDSPFPYGKKYRNDVVIKRLL